MRDAEQRCARRAAVTAAGARPDPSAGPGGAAGGWVRLGLGGARTADVVPFPGPRRPEAPREEAEGEAEIIPVTRRIDAVRSWNTARDRTGRPPTGSRPDPGPADIPAGDAAEEAADQTRRTAAETQLRRALGRSAKSVREARGMLCEGGRLDEAQAEAVVQRFRRLGYLDDAALAEQIVRRQRERGRGTTAIRQQLHERGVEPQAAELALASIDLEDERERAVRLAAARAPRLRALAADTALRRLVGFLQRRGYDAGTSLEAARTVLGTGPEEPESTGFDS